MDNSEIQTASGLILGRRQLIAGASALGLSAILGASPPALLEAKVENFFASFFDPQCGQGVPFQRLERTNTSLSRSQPSQ